MPNTQMTEQEVEALRQVVHYLFADEKKHWEEMGRPSDHIFERVLELKTYLIANYGKAK